MGSTRIDSALPAPSNVFSPQWGRRWEREGQRGWSKSVYERGGRRIKKERNKERERELAWSWKQSRRFNPTRLRSLPGNFSSSPSSPSRFIPRLQRTTFPFCYSKRRPNVCTRVYIYMYAFHRRICVYVGVYKHIQAREKSEMGKRKERER